LTGISLICLRSRMFSYLFFPCSNSLVPLKFRHSCGYPFVYMGTIAVVSHSSVICSSSKTLFSISCNMSTPVSPTCFIRSIGRPEHHAGFPLDIFSMDFFTSFPDIIWTGPSTAGTSTSRSCVHPDQTHLNEQQFKVTLSNMAVS